jgi:hypothetical protein
MPTRRISDDCIVKIGSEYTAPDGASTGDHIVWIIQSDDERRHEILLYPHDVDALIAALQDARRYGKSPETADRQLLEAR